MEVEKRPDLSVQLSGIELKNPVILASGTCGFGEEIAEFIDLNKVGAIVTKTVTLGPKEGNPPPRIAEVEGGIVNSIGLENPGVEEFISGKLPFLKGLQTPFFVSISGNTVNEFQRLAAILDKEKSISAVELNLSCPNITHGNCLFAQDPKISYQTIKKVKEA
ncbi:MAG TPA: dihydroorotate dehydrogenase, partial [Candidatus Omnitrophica bacterium]|nr:dihydroorotate dehydrogenase [Candidatus Omnitrophota bacterium]